MTEYKNMRTKSSAARLCGRAADILSRAAAALLAAVIAFCAVPASAERSYFGDMATVRIPIGASDLLYYDENGSVSGYGADYLSKLAEINSWKYEYIDAPDITEAENMLKSGRIDLMLPELRSTEREEFMDYSSIACGYMASALFVNAGSECGYEDYAHFGTPKIAISEDPSEKSGLDAFAKLHAFEYEPVFLASVEDRLYALKSGMVDMVMMNASEKAESLKIVAVFDAHPFYITVKKDNAALLSEVNDGMNHLLMTSPEIAAAMFHDGFIGQNHAIIAFTTEESAFIDSKEKITVGFYEINEPLSYIDDNGGYDGLYVKLLEEIARETGINIEFFPISRDYYWVDLINSKTIDFFIGANFAEPEKSGFLYTDSFSDAELILISRKDHRFTGSKPTIAITSARAYMAESMLSTFDSMEIIFYRTAKDCLLAVKNGEADFSMLNATEYNYQSKNSRFSDLIQLDNYRFKIGTYMCTRQDIDTVKFSVMNKAAQLLAASDISGIVNQCLNITYHGDASDFLYSSRWLLTIIFIVAAATVICVLIVASVRRKQRRLLLESEKHEQHNLQILAALSADFAGVYLVNLDNDSFVIAKLADRLRQSVSEVAQMSTVFSHTIRMYIDAFVQDRYKDTLIRMLKKDALIERFKHDNEFSVRYQVNPNPENQNYFEMRFVSVTSKKNENHMVLGFRCIDDTVREEMEQKMVLEDANESLRRQMRIIKSFGSIYFAIFIADLDKMTAEVVELPDIMSSVRESVNNGLKPFSDALIKMFVSDRYKDEVYAFIDVDTIEERLNNNAVISYEFFSVHSLWYRLNIIPVEHAGDSKSRQMIFAIQEIDDEKRKELETQEALKFAYNDAQKANNAKSDFLSRISHDMRTPMNAIIGMTTIASTYIDDKERVSDSLKKITSASRHLLALINEVLDMSKIESGSFTLAEEDFGFSELMHRLVLMILPDIAAHRHTLNIHVGDMEHENVRGDSLRLQQIFLNIVGNSIKYTPDNGTITVSISEKSVDSDVAAEYEFVFLDNGIGMDKDFIEHIFEPFTRAEDPRTSKIQGTGLGMPITQNIVRMMNGHIAVESEPGKGSKFTVTIPLKWQDNQETAAEELKGLSVLIAESDRTTGEAVCGMLNGIGMECELAQSAEELLKRVKARHEQGNDYYAVIIDRYLPDNNGLSAVKTVKDAAGGASVVILAAYDISDIETDARDVGIDAFINKPMFRSGLVKVFKQLLNPSSDDDAAKLSAVGGRDRYDGKHVLLVEDNELNREIAEEIIGMTGATVETAENGKKALDMFNASEKGYYDIIFMDVQMPIMNGYDSTKAIRASGRDDSAAVPIVAMTANAFTDDVQNALDAGMNEHLAKPLDFAKLAAVMRKYLRG